MPTDPNQRLLDAILRTDLELFLRRTFSAVAPGAAFEPNWHIEAICWRLEQVLRGNITRLIVTLPPRSLKSIAASVALPAFALGHDPTRRIVTASYSGELAIKHANGDGAGVALKFFSKCLEAVTTLVLVKLAPNAPASQPETVRQHHFGVPPIAHHPDDTVSIGQTGVPHLP